MTLRSRVCRKKNHSNIDIFQPRTAGKRTIQQTDCMILTGMERKMMFQQETDTYPRDTESKQTVGFDWQRYLASMIDMQIVWY